MSAYPGADTTSAASRTSRDEFLGLICADDELLRVEFDAIIEATRPRLVTVAVPPCGEPLTGARPALGPAGRNRH